MPSITNYKLESEIKPKPIRYKLWRDGQHIVGDFNNIGLHHGKRASKIKFCVLLVTAAFTPNAKNNENKNEIAVDLIIRYKNNAYFRPVPSIRL